MFVILLLLLLSSPVYAESYTIILSLEEESTLAFVIEPGETHQQHLQNRITGLLRSYAVQQKEEQTKQLRDRYDAATAEQRRQVDDILRTGEQAHAGRL